MKPSPKPLTYKDSGVDVALGDEFVAEIRNLLKNTSQNESVSEIGGFAGAFPLFPTALHDPVILACTDGVGTKLKWAFELNRHDTIGIDLVAMSVNDLLVSGATPLFFLDYLATGKLDPGVHLQVIRGIIRGCEIANCALLGGETAEMPGMYAPGEYDLAGFAVGLADRNKLLNPARVQSGDILIGFPSSGFHSNGHSLIRAVFRDRKKFPLDKRITKSGETLGRALLEPTRIYSREFKVLNRTAQIHSAAHITGGGITGNLPRALPPHLGAEIFTRSWSLPPIYDFFCENSHISTDELFKTFNMGIGMIAVCSRRDIPHLQHALTEAACPYSLIGRVTDHPGIRYVERSFPDHSSSAQRKRPRIRLAIFGSGRGSNMDSIEKAIRRGDLHAEIACVVSNNSRSGILKRSRERGIPVKHISSRTHPDPADFSQAILDCLKSYRVDLVCLAGYMKKIPAAVSEAYRDRILNIHPALLPAFGGKNMYGMNVHQAVIRSGAKVSGATVHIVNAEYDTGRIIAQRIVPVRADDTAETLAARVLRVEHALYWRAIAEYIDTLS